MRITREIWLQFKRREVPMAERNGGNLRLFSLRELHFRLEFLIITPMGEHHFAFKTAQRSRDQKNSLVEHTE
jgi:hypothetical protein